MKTSEEYVEAGGSECPACGSGHMKLGEIVPPEHDSIVWQSITCTGCGAKWDEIYKLAGYEEFISGIPDVVG